MASPSSSSDDLDGQNPFDKYDAKPKSGRHSEGLPVEDDEPNPFDKYDQQPATSDTGLNPARAALYEQEKGHPLDAMMRELREAGQSLKGIGSAVARPFAMAGEGALLPLDAAHSVERFVNAGDYSPTAMRKAFVYGPVDDQMPSQQARAWLDAHTVAPQDTAGRVAEMISSGVIGARMPGMPRAQPGLVPPSTADDVIAAGLKHKVPVYYDDVTKSAFAKKLGVGAENVPLVGTSSGRAAQSQASKDAAGRVAARFDIADAVPQAIQTGLQKKLAQFREDANSLYTKASGLLDKGGYVDTPEFNDAINAEIQRQASLGTAANPAVVTLLQKYKNAPGGDFSLMRQIRSQLKGEISDFYTGGANKAIGARGVERLTGMRDALEADMKRFAQRQGGKAYDSWKEADSFYKTNLVPFKEQGFADLVRTAEPEKAWRYLLAQGGIESRAARMYNSLTDAGRGAVRAGLVNDALDNAVSPKGIFSPAKFAKYMEDNSTVVDHFFKGADKEEINGFTNLMRHVDRAGQYMENPPTGQRVIGALMLGSAAVSMKPLLIGAAAAGGTRVLFQTQRGRDLLLAASKLKPGSPAMNVIGNRIGRLMVSGAATANREIPDTEQEQEASPDVVSQ